MARFTGVQKKSAFAAAGLMALNGIVAATAAPEAHNSCKLQVNVHGPGDLCWKTSKGEIYCDWAPWGKCGYLECGPSLALQTCVVTKWCCMSVSNPEG